MAICLRPGHPDLMCVLCVWAMEYYGFLGDLYERNKDNKTAMIAFKKMLQFSWINKAVAFELAAYFGIARQYFYMQMLEKADYYLDRSLNGKCE